MPLLRVLNVSYMPQLILMSDPCHNKFSYIPVLILMSDPCHYKLQLGSIPSIPTNNQNLQQKLSNLFLLVQHHPKCFRMFYTLTPNRAGPSPSTPTVSAGEPLVPPRSCPSVLAPAPAPSPLRAATETPSLQRSLGTGLRRGKCGERRGVFFAWGIPKRWRLIYKDYLYSTTLANDHEMMLDLYLQTLVCSRPKHGMPVHSYRFTYYWVKWSTWTYELVGKRAY